MKDTNKKYVAIVVALHSEGKTKDQVMDALQDAGIKLKDFNKVMKDSGVKFGSGGSKGWREASTAAFIENPMLSLTEYIELLKEIPDLKNHEVKAKYHYKMMADIAQHFNQG